MNNTTNITGLSNATSVVDASLDVATTVIDWVPLIFSRLWDLIAAPFVEQDMLWILFHLVLTLVVLEFYFDRHGGEELGWAAAVANSLVLFIISFDLLRHSFPGDTPWQVFQSAFLAAFTDATLPIPSDVFIMIVFVGLLGVAITIVNYYHLLPRKLAFEVSGHPPINFLAFLAIVIVYTADTSHAVPLDITTLLAGAVLFVLMLAIFFFLKRTIKGFFKSHGKTRHRS